MDLRRSFTNYQAILEKHKEELYNLQFYPEDFKRILDTFSINEGTTSYSSSPLKVILPKKWIPGHTIPDGLDHLVILLDIKDEIKIRGKVAKRVEDPIAQLIQFNLILSSGDYTSSWHLDRHIKGDTDGEGKYTHPIYHWTYGGFHIESEHNEKGKDFGYSLFLRNPRLMHPPMELILGLDFVFNQFIPNGELELLNDKVYIQIIKEFKDYFWKPYALAFAKSFCGTMDIDHERLTFDDIFVKSVSDN